MVGAGPAPMTRLASGGNETVTTSSMAGGVSSGQGTSITMTPEDVAACKASYTGKFLKAHLRERSNAPSG